MYSIEVNANPVIRDKNRFIKDVGRGLHPSPLPTELLSEIGILHASVSFSVSYFKDFELILRTSIICVGYGEPSDLAY